MCNRIQGLGLLYRDSGKEKIIGGISDFFRSQKIIEPPGASISGTRAGTRRWHDSVVRFSS